VKVQASIANPCRAQLPRQELVRDRRYPRSQLGTNSRRRNQRDGTWASRPRPTSGSRRSAIRLYNPRDPDKPSVVGPEGGGRGTTRRPSMWATAPYSTTRSDVMGVRARAHAVDATESCGQCLGVDHLTLTRAGRAGATRPILRGE
jgi:hypothetical protein